MDIFDNIIFFLRKKYKNEFIKYFEILIFEWFFDDFFLNKKKQKKNLLYYLILIYKKQNNFAAGVRTTKTHCNHYYHESCISNWIQSGSNVCPSCRSPIVERPQASQNIGNNLSRNSAPYQARYKKN